MPPTGRLHTWQPSTFGWQLPMGTSMVVVVVVVGPSLVVMAVSSTHAPPTETNPACRTCGAAGEGERRAAYPHGEGARGVVRPR